MFLGLWGLRNYGAIRNKSIRISKEYGEKINEENTINWKIG